MEPTSKHRPEEPLVRLGQGDFTRDLYPDDLELPHANEGGCVAVCVFILVFLIGFALGALLL